MEDYKMPVSKGKTTQVTFVMDSKAVELIDYYAEKVDRSRSQMLRNMVMSGLDDAKIMNALGVFDLIKVKNWLKDGRQLRIPTAD